MLLRRLPVINNAMSLIHHAENTAKWPQTVLILNTRHHKTTSFFLYRRLREDYAGFCTNRVL